MTDSEEFDAFAEDLLHERFPRPLVIVGASKVDRLLVEILRTYFIPKSSKLKDADELLDGDAPLATFSSRIKILRRLGLIDETLFEALEKFRTIRNLSAHSIKFDDTKSPIREHLGDLKKKISFRHSFELTKIRYFDPVSLSKIEELQCLILTLCVLLEAVREKTKQTRGSKATLSIAAK